MNVVRGLKRTFFVCAFFWVIGWSGYAWIGYQQSQYGLGEIAELERTDPEAYANLDFASEHVRWIDVVNEGEHKITLSVEVGLFVPLSLLILSPFAWFIYRGFNPSSKLD